MYTRVKVLTPSEVWSHLVETRPYNKRESKKEIQGYRVQCYSLRLLTFRRSLTCVSCGITGSFFALERFTRDPSPDFHLNLYASVNGKEVLMTKDHIVPKSKGGKDTLDNLQTMCTYCNCAKGNTYEERVCVQ